MAGYSLAQLPWPPHSRRVDLLDPEFETRQAAFAEDQLRAARLREQAGRHGGDWGRRAAELADEIDPEVTEHSTTLAAMRAWRDPRIRITGELLRLADEDQTGRVARFDVIKPRDVCDLNAQIDRDPNRMLQSLRVDISRVGKSLPQGFLFAGHHNEFNSTTQMYQEHAHVFATGDYIDRLEALRDLRSYKRTSEVRTPIRASSKLENLPHALTYLLKSYILERPTLPLGANGTSKRPRSGQRMKEPYHCDWLLWMDRWDLADLTLFMGLRFGKHGLVVIRP